MAITQYNLLLKAMLDPSSGDAIDQKIKEIQTRAQNQAVIKIKVIPDYAMSPTGQWEPTGDEIRQVTATYTNQMGKAVTETHNLQYVQGQYAQTLGNTATFTDKANLSTYNFGKQLKNVALATLESMVTYQLVNRVLQSIGDSIQYVKDLSKEMTNIQLVSGGSDQEIKNLAVGYNVLAKEMGATTIEIAKGI